MFEQTLIAAPEARRQRAIGLALAAHAVLVTGVSLLPLIKVQPLGPVKQIVVRPPVQATPKHLEQTQMPPARGATRPLFSVSSLKQLFDRSGRIVDIAPIGPPAPLVGSTFGSGGEAVGVPGGEIRLTPPPKTAPEPKPVLPVRLTSVIARSQLVYGPKPAYPRLALISRSEGTVKLQAIISRDGNIENLHVVTGPPLLVQAAMDAVRPWRYRPLLLNGEPVEVITEIDVVFTLH